MQLPAIIRSAAALKLERQLAELVKAEAARAELQAKLASLDVEADTYPIDAQTLNAQLSVNQKAIDILSLQIAGLEAKAKAAAAAEKERRRQLAIKKVEELLPQWAAAADKFEKWLRAGDAALAALKAARKQIAHEWPKELEPPYEFHFDLNRAIKMLRAAVTSKGVESEAADGYAAYEREQMNDLLNGLKNPTPPIEDEKAA